MRQYAVLIVGALAGAASGQVVNGGFETGVLAPWVPALTANGSSPVQDVVAYDIDGPGPLPATNQSARFQVGQAVFTPGGAEGVQVTQSVQLQGGTAYPLHLDWAVQRYVNVNNGDGGTFAIIVDGTELVSAASGSVTGLTPIYGALDTQFTPPATGAYSVGFRITRQFLVAGSLFQYVDNFSAGSAPCYADCNADGALTVADFGCFQTKFVASDPYADCNADGGLTVADFGCFQTKFVAGCP